MCGRISYGTGRFKWSGFYIDSLANYWFNSSVNNGVCVMSDPIQSHPLKEQIISIQRRLKIPRTGRGTEDLSPIGNCALVQLERPEYSVGDRGQNRWNDFVLVPKYDLPILQRYLQSNKVAERMREQNPCLVGVLEEAIRQETGTEDERMNVVYAWAQLTYRFQRIEVWTFTPEPKE